MFLTYRNACVGLMAAMLLAVPAAAQTGNQFDNSANSRLQGSYFVREVLLTNPSQNGNGTFGTAVSATGTVVFDGAGNYTFNGTVATCNPPTCTPQQTTNPITGYYSLAANGFLRIDSLVGTYIDNSNQTQIDVAYGGVGVAGPNAFVASATEATNYDLLIGIPMNASATNASFNGTFNTAYLDFLQGDVTKVRNATFPLKPDGQGNLGTVGVSGYAVNLGNVLLSQPTSATYSLSNFTTTGGTINFGTSSSPAASLISGSKAFMISPDGKLLLGGSLTDFDMLVGTPAVANPTNALYTGFYFIGAQEDDSSELIPQGVSAVDTYYGSTSATGTGGFFIDHLRYAQPGFYPYDWTYNEAYSVPANGDSFQPVGDPDRYMLGAGGQVVIGSGIGSYYSLALGLQAPTYSGSGVFLNPLGIVNAANYAPATNPVAPLEMVVLFGTGLASADWDATTFPLATVTPNDDQLKVLINGAPAPLFKVRASTNPQLVYVLVPSGISPEEKVFFATFQVVNQNGTSKPVTMYTNYTAPGVFAASQGGVGDAAALHPGNVYNPVTAANPAHAGETVELFLDGLGSVNPTIPDGEAALSAAPFNLVTANTRVTIDTDAQVPFVGMAPGYTGLYQVNATIPSGISANDWYIYVNAYDPAGNDGGLTDEATIEVSGAASGSSVAAFAQAMQPPHRTSHHGVPRPNGSRPVSGRLPHTAQ